MLWDGINPVFGVRVRLDLLLVFVIFDRNVKLETLSLMEARLHDSVSW